MKIGVLCSFPFPEGLAATTRIIAYCKGLQNIGVECEIFTFAWHLSDDKMTADGAVQGVPYHIGHCSKNNRNKIIRRIFDKPQNERGVLKKIFSSNQVTPFDFILVSCDLVPKLRYFLPRLRKHGIKTIFVSDEFPQAIRELKTKVPEKDIAAYRDLLNYVKGRVLMTRALQEYYDNINNTSPTCLLNTVVDVHRFDNVMHTDGVASYLCYMGNCELAKDNVDNIIKAFSMIHCAHPELELRIYGSPNPLDKATLENLIQKLGISDRVKLMGRVSYNEVPQILVDAKVLVSSQPVTKRADGGFPTKLGEYLMTGVPTLLTDVGEIHEYVKDGENAFLVPPLNPTLYAERLEYILTHKEEIKTVVEKAKDYIINNFSAEAAGITLNNFFKELQK